MSGGDQEQLCVVDSDTGQILYYFNPSTGEMKWINQPPKEIEISKDNSPQQQGQQTSTNRGSSSSVPDASPKSAMTKDDTDHQSLKTNSNDKQTKTESKECSNLISGEVVTVLLEPSSDGNRLLKPGSNDATTERQEVVLVRKDAGALVNGVTKMVSRKRKPVHGLQDDANNYYKKPLMDSGNPPVTSSFQCRKCDKVSTSAQEFALHLRSHQDTTALYKCPRCYRGFTNPKALASHVTLHILAKPFLCGDCDKTFTSEGGLTVHMATTHAGLKPFSCLFCSARFAHACALTAHLASHLGQRSCRCNFCQKRFSNTKDLSAHVQTHNDVQGEKAKTKRKREIFCCMMCTRSFDEQNDLDSHMRGSHTKPFGASNISPLKQLQALIIKETPTFESRVSKMRAARLPSQDKKSSRGVEGYVNDFRPPRREENMDGVDPLRQLQALTYRGDRTVHERKAEQKVASGTTPQGNRVESATIGEVSSSRQAEKNENNSDFQARKEKAVDASSVREVFTPPTHGYSPPTHGFSPPTHGFSPPTHGFSLSEGNDARHIKIVRCHQCDKIFASPSELANHLRDHNDTYIKCTKCPKVFTRECDLKLHEPAHEGKPTLKCPSCDKTFIHSHGLNLHLRVHTGEKPFTCKHCGKAFAHSGNLTVHLRTHTGEKPYQCEFCHQAFNHSSNLKNHMRLHTGEKPYRCKTCARTFSRSSHLRNHVVNHSLPKTETQLYRCDVCDKSFDDLDLLSDHVKTHTDTRPHQCQYCGKAFSVPSGLTVHLRTHTGEKPYRCDYCPRAFSHSSNLKVHVRTHTGEKPYCCPSCSTTFARSSDLRRHVYMQGCSQKLLNEASMGHDLANQTPYWKHPLNAQNRSNTTEKIVGVGMISSPLQSDAFKEKDVKQPQEVKTEIATNVSDEDGMKRNERVHNKKRRFVLTNGNRHSQESGPSPQARSTGYPAHIESDNLPIDVGKSTGYPAHIESDNLPTDVGQSTGYPAHIESNNLPKDVGKSTGYPAHIESNNLPTDVGKSTGYPAHIESNNLPTDVGKSTGYPVHIETVKISTDVEKSTGHPAHIESVEKKNNTCAPRDYTLESPSKLQPPDFLLSTLALQPRKSQEITSMVKAPDQLNPSVIEVSVGPRKTVQNYSRFEPVKPVSESVAEPTQFETRALSENHREPMIAVAERNENSSSSSPSPDSPHREPIIETSSLQPLQALTDSIEY